MIEQYKHNDYCVLKIKIEEANLGYSESLKDEVDLALGKGFRFMIVDFSGVRYVDSTFLAALVSALKKAMAHNGDIAVTRLNKDILHLFKLLRMDKVFKIFPELPESFTGSFGRNGGQEQ